MESGVSGLSGFSGYIDSPPGYWAKDGLSGFSGYSGVSGYIKQFQSYPEFPKVIPKVYIAQYEAGDTRTTIGASLDPIKSLKMFTAFLDSMETIWRGTDKTINPRNTFNRFSEPTDQYKWSASVWRFGELHFVSVQEIPID
jgi:hypothetical protein